MASNKTKKKAAPAKKMAVTGGSKKVKGTDSAQNKTVLRVLIVAVVAVILVYGMNLFHGGGDVRKPFTVQPLLKISGEEKPCGHFTAWGIAPIGKDKFVVTDQENSRLLIFDREGKFLRSIGKKGPKADEFQEPSGMAFDSKGNAYVIDTWNGAIKGFDEKGKEILNMDLTKFKNFYGPRGIFFDGKDFLVADTGSHRIAVLSPDGNMVASWGGMGTAPGQFKGPLAVASDGKGDYYVADSDNNRFQILDRDGKSVKVVKMGGAVWAIALDHEGRVYVSSMADNGSVKVYDPKGNYIGDLADANGNSDAFRGAHWLSISDDDTLMLTIGTTASLFKIPASPKS